MNLNPLSGRLRAGSRRVSQSMIFRFFPCISGIPRLFLYVISCCSRLQLSFSENGPWSSSEEKERVAETDDTCYGKGIGFGSQPMKIAEASSRRRFRFCEIVCKQERCFRYHAFPQDRTAIKVVVRPHCKMDQGKHTLNLHPTQEKNKHGRSKMYHLGGI